MTKQKPLNFGQKPGRIVTSGAERYLTKLVLIQKVSSGVRDVKSTGVYPGRKIKVDTRHSRTRICR